MVASCANRTWAAAALLFTLVWARPAALPALSNDFGYESAPIAIAPDVRQVLAADFDLDGRLDLFKVARTHIQWSATGHTSVMFGVGLGSLGAESCVLGGIISPGRALATDLDGDGRTDVVVPSSHGFLRLFVNRAPSAPNAPCRVDFVSVDLPALGSAMFVAAGDFNGDQIVDLAQAGSAHQLFLYFGTGLVGSLPTFAAPIAATPAGFGFPAGLEVLDLDGDGWDDIVLASTSLGSGVRVFWNELGSGNPIWTNQLVWPTAHNLAGLAKGDVDGDGQDDVVAVSFSEPLITLLNNGSRTPAVVLASNGLGATAGSPSLADLDGDGALDLVFVDRASPSLEVVYNRPPLGRFDLAHLVSNSTAAALGDGALGSPLVADLDRDGDLDLPLVLQSTQSVAVLSGQRNASPRQPRAYLVQRGVSASGSIAELATRDGLEARCSGVSLGASTWSAAQAIRFQLGAAAPGTSLRVRVRARVSAGAPATLRVALRRIDTGQLTWIGAGSLSVGAGDFEFVVPTAARFVDPAGHATLLLTQDSGSAFELALDHVSLEPQP